MATDGAETTEYWLIVVELDDVVPRRDPTKPNLYVATSTSPPEKRFETISGTKKIHWFSKHIVRLRSDLSTSKNYVSREEARLAKKDLIRILRSEGYTVNQNTDVWTVYVVELDKSAVANPGKGYVYVGETRKSPEQRFREHKEGARNSKGPLSAGVVRRHGVRLRPDLAPKTKYFDSQSAKKAEREHFELLKSKGYKVKGGH